ncbi:MAG: ABC transporter permease [Actinomycetota bacterium]|nr:ABC transporter permease [Actinomycetota bacterium]
MTATTEERPDLDEVEDLGTAIDPEADDPGGTGAWSKIRGAMGGSAGLIITPFVIAGVALTLYVLVSGAEKSVAEASALDWSSNLRPQLEDHIWLTVVSTIFVLLIAVPLGVALTRPSMRRFAGPILAFANTGQAAPAYGLFVLLYAWMSTGFRTSVVALVIYTVLPVLRNTMVGLDQVDRAIIEAGRGMGMTQRQALLKIEMPLAVPVILAGVRTALIINVGMATLAFLIGGGGLGVTISAGLKLQRDMILVTGATMAGILALTIDWLGAVAERYLKPKGI